MSGQSITDRINAAKYSLSGQGLARIVCKATTEEFNAPKKKHVDYLIQCTNEPNVSIPQMANLLIERVHGRDWIVVYKSLITIHNLINFGNERFTQYLASNNCSFQLDNFCDKNAPQASHMFKFISRYSKYIHRKCYSYRMEGYDFCKVKRGKDDGVLRAMNGEKLLKTLPILQSQLEGLLDFDATVSDLGNNSIIYACFILLFKDLIRLFACYNDGIINLLETYFEMNKKQCKEALDIYKRFLVGMERVSGFLKLAENMGVDKGDIPDLAKAPASLLEALESHLQSLDGKMGSTTPTGQNRPAGFASAIDNFTKASGDVSSSISEDERRKALEEENRTLSIFNQKAGSPSGIAASTNPFASSAANNKSPTQNGSARPIDDLLGLSGPTNPFDATVNQSGSASAFLTDDLFSSAPPSKQQAGFAFGAPVQSSFPDSAAFTSEPKAQSPFHENSNLFSAPSAAAYYGAPQRGIANSPTHAIPPTQSPSHRPNTGPTGFAGASTNPWASQSAQQRPPFQGNAEINFDKGFGFATQPSTNTSSFDAFGPVIAPTNQTISSKSGSESKLIKEDLDASLANIVGNLGMGPGVQMKKEHQWTASPNRGMLTGGATWTPAAPPTKAAPNTLGWGQPQQPGMNLTGLQPSPISATATVHNPFLITQAQPATQKSTKPIDPFDSLLN